MFKDFNDYYDYLANVVGVSTEALDLAFSLVGCTEETASKILYFYTGYHDFEDYQLEIGGNWG